MDTTFPYKPTKIAKAFSERIHSGVFPLKSTDAESVLEFLYMAYADVQGRDSKEIDQGFLDLDTHLSKFSLEKITKRLELYVNYAMLMRNVPL